MEAVGRPNAVGLSETLAHGVAGRGFGLGRGAGTGALLAEPHASDEGGFGARRGNRYPASMAVSLTKAGAGP